MRKLVTNIISLLTSDLLNRTTTFVVYALVARYLGDFGFGQMSLALLLLYTFYVFAGLGLRIYITREVARDLSLTSRYLVNASVLVLGAALLSLGILGVFVFLMGYTPSTALLIMVVGLAIVPYALSSVNEAIFQAWEQMHLIAYANIPHNIVKVGATFALLAAGYGALEVGIALVASYSLTLTLAWLFTLRMVGRKGIQWHVDFPFMRTTLIHVLPFLGLESVIAIWTSLNALLLSRFGNEVDVGYYNAAMQILVPINLVLYSIVMSIFPRMVREFDQHSSDLQRVYEDLIELLLIITLPAVVGLMLLAEPILLLLYGNASFANATVILQIVAWSLVPLALNRALGQVLLATMQERITLRIVVINTIISLILGLILINLYGVVGAAIATLVTRLINLAQQYRPVSRVLGSVGLLKSSWKAALASMGMGIVLSIFADRLNLLLAILIGAVIYTTLLCLIMLWSYGGVKGIQAHYHYLQTRGIKSAPSGQTL